MRRPASLFQRRSKTQQRLVRMERAIRYRIVNLWQVHPDDTARAYISVPNLGIAHLPFRQANIRSVGR